MLYVSSSTSASGGQLLTNNVEHNVNLMEFLNEKILDCSWKLKFGSRPDNPALRIFAITSELIE